MHPGLLIGAAAKLAAVSPGPGKGGGAELSPSKLIAELKACGDLETGKNIHVRMMESRHEFPVHVTNTLMDMYAKYGSMVDARHLFDNIRMRSVVSWNVMILGYAKKEEGGLALELFTRMQQEGLTPNTRTWIGALKACSSLATLGNATKMNGNILKERYLETGRAIHHQVVDRGFEADLYVGTMLVDMYTKCGSMEDARHVFDKLPHRDVVSWTAMILGYTDTGEDEMALGLFAQMQHEGIAPGERTFVAALKACSSLAMSEDETEVDGHCVKMGCLEKGRVIHSQVIAAGFESNVFVGTTVIDMYASCGSMVDARRVFDKLPHRDVVSWNAMIQGYAQATEGELALELYAQMQQEGVSPNDRTFVAVLKACSSLAALEAKAEVDGKFVQIGCLEKVRAIHPELAKLGFGLDVFLGTTLVDIYAKCGSMKDALCAFDNLHVRDVVTWTAMILGYVEQGESDEALRLYARMLKQGPPPNSWTFVCILKACGNAAALEMGIEIHAQICRAGIDADVIVATALVDMYGKCGSMVHAQHVFDASSTRDLVMWNALIAGYACQGEHRLVFRLFQRMKQEGIQPNGITFLSILTLCSHAGLVHEGQEYFVAMTKDYGIGPSMEHYTCMADIFGRAGQVDEAMAMVKNMPFPPDLVMWTTVLGACRKWANVEAGRHAYEHAVRLDKNSSAAYVLMSNIYADAHMWEDSDEIQAMRESAQAWKKPGQSWWTDTGGMVHTFAAGDTKHPQSRDIYATLRDLSVRMSEKGYVPDLNSVLWDKSDDEKEDALCGHNEKLAIACALVNTPPGTAIRVVKNLRVCDDCHEAMAVISKIEGRQIICRDASRFHVYEDGKCTCGSYW